MASRSISDLDISFQSIANDFVKACTTRGIDVVIYCTFRSSKEQARLYRNGRSLAAIEAKAKELREKYGRSDLAQLLLDVGPQHGDKIVTNAGPGQSLHNYGFALDGAPMKEGKIVWDKEDPMWTRYGLAAYDVGVEWAGDWKGSLQETPHIQMPKKDWHELIRS